MPELFSIETDRVHLSWSAPGTKDPPLLRGASAPPGRLIIYPKRRDLSFGTGTWRAGVPEAVAGRPDETAGPRLYEQTDYALYIRGKSDDPLALESRDPVLLSGLTRSEGGRVIHGILNFGSQAGLSEFSLRVGMREEFGFLVEVFPTKLDYASDYQQLLAEVQDIHTGLVLEYLRSTFQLGAAATIPQPTHLEWLTLLRHVATDLKQAFDVIAQRPHWGLTRDPQPTRIERVRRSNTAARAAIIRGKGSGRLLPLDEKISVREQILEARSRATLDTPEHRWLSAQLAAIRRGLSELRKDELQRRLGERRESAIREIDALLSLFSRMASSAPISSASAAPPAGFASLQLLRAPGYREAYRACLILSLGLRLEGGPVRLSVKDLSLLYEYWCVLALIRLIAEETGQPIPARELLAIERNGLRVLLQRGREQTVHFSTRAGRKISVIYNPVFRHNVLTPQQPDIVVTIEDPEWPLVRLVLDAKYRLDASAEYVDKYASPGPPEDAVNVLHRYRDAILELDQIGTEPARPKRSVIQAAALFPYQVSDPDNFFQSRLWSALERLGVGALPFLPGSTEYVSAWLRSNLRAGGWAISERAIDHRSQERARNWRTAAAEVTLVGVLRGGAEKAHLEWIQENKIYYLPLLKTQRRQYAARCVAIYSPLALRSPGAVTHFADVLDIQVVRRDEISTPWPAGADADRLHVLYRLGGMDALPHPVLNKRPEGRAARFSTHRWTSRLGLLRASFLEELFLETEPEWKLYEELRARGILFECEPGPARLLDPEEPLGRTWFVAQSGRAQFRGAAGFLFRSRVGTQAYYARVEEAAEQLACS